MLLVTLISSVDVMNGELGIRLDTSQWAGKHQLWWWGWWWLGQTDPRSQRGHRRAVMLAGAKTPGISDKSFFFSILISDILSKNMAGGGVGAEWRWVRVSEPPLALLSHNTTNRHHSICGSHPDASVFLDWLFLMVYCPYSLMQQTAFTKFIWLSWYVLIWVTWEQ